MKKLCLPVLSLFLIICLSPQLLKAQDDDFIRQPPRRVIFTKHTRSDSDPQQVQNLWAVWRFFVYDFRKYLSSFFVNYFLNLDKVHISLVGKDHMRVSWVTDSKHGKSVVEYGKAPGKYNSKATGEDTSYKYFFYSSGKIHHVTIGPLEPATMYYYRCGGSEQEFSFKTPPQKLPLEFAVAGKSCVFSFLRYCMELVTGSVYNWYVMLLDSQSQTHISARF